MSYKTTDWAGAYDLPWKGLLWEDKETGESAFSHPAKMARGLCLKIVEYALQNGLIEPGQTVLDPFGGVGTTALPSLMNGLNYVGCELESRFVEMGRKNIELWNGKFSSMPKWVGSAVLLQGDSRFLTDVIAGAGLVVSSPPYGNNAADTGYIDENWSDGRKRPIGASQRNNQGYGNTVGNLGNLPPGSLSAVIASPPFAGNTGGRGEASRNGIDAALFDRHSGGMKKGTGSDPANLDHLPMGTVTAVLQRNNVEKRRGLMYFFFLSPNNSVAALIEVGVSLNVFRHLSLGGVPIFSINFDNGIKFRQEEVSRVRPYAELSVIDNTFSVKEFREGILKPTLFGPTVTLNRAIDPAPILEAIRLSEEYLLTNRALLFDAGFLEVPGALEGAKFTLTPINSGDLRKELLPTLETELTNFLGNSNSGAFVGTILCPLFGLTVTDSDWLPTDRTSNINSVSEIQTLTFSGTEFTIPPINLTDNGIELITAVFANSLNNCRHNLTIARNFPIIIPESKREVNGSSSGQLGAMVVGSPPFAGSIGSDDPAKRGGLFRDEKRANDTNLTGSYGQSDGQLGAMVVGSPPFEKQNSGGGLSKVMRGEETEYKDLTGRQRQNEHSKPGYMMQGDSPGQIANESGETFWAASKQILDQCYQILPDGAAAIWVTKRYVKDGKIVDFSQQWATLCEACGFEVVEWIRASLIKNGGAGQVGIDGEVVNKSVKRSSFFRRLHEKKRPDLAIDWEDVIVTRKKAAQ